MIFFTALASFSLLRMTSTVENALSNAAQDLEYVAELMELSQQLRVLSVLLENVRTHRRCLGCGRRKPINI